MELNNVIENLKANLKSSQEELDFHTNKAKEYEVNIYRLSGALELANALQKDAATNSELKTAKLDEPVKVEEKVIVEETTTNPD